MVRRPREYRDALVVPKRQDAPSTPAAADDRVPYAHTLSMRLPMDQYRRLRRWAAAEEERTGRRITHQAVFEAALAEFLDKHSG